MPRLNSHAKVVNRVRVLEHFTQKEFLRYGLHASGEWLYAKVDLAPPHG